MGPPLLLHNPNCSKSRGALEILRDRGVEVDVVQYLKAPPDRAQLERIVAGLDTPPASLVRTGEATFKELGLTKDDIATADAVVDLLSEHPRLIERPVLVVGDRSVIGRPPERVLELLD